MSSRISPNVDRTWVEKFRDKSRYCDWYMSNMDFNRVGHDVVTESASYITVVQYVREFHPEATIYFVSSLGWQDHGERMRWRIPDEDVAFAVKVKFG